MTTTIAQQVSHLVETMAAQPPNEVMGALAGSRRSSQPVEIRRG